MTRRFGRRRSDEGQSALEFALVLPLLIGLVLGVVEVSYGLIDMHVTTSLSREGANLISRNTSLQDAANVLRQMAARPINFDDGSSRVIFSVVMRVPTVGSSNYDHDVLYQRYEYGTLPASSHLAGGAGAFGPAPDYQALDANDDTGLRVTNLPTNLVTLGSMIYVTEIFTKHDLITPLDRFGVHVPDQLYSIAYF
jgi:TadE-like protein